MRKLLFLTGTRADFGKLKSLIQICLKSSEFQVHIFATGMHMHHKYGHTVKEIEKSNFPNIFKFINYTSESTMDLTMAKTIEGLSAYIREEKPDLIIVHGDRVEALAGAIVGALNNILVAHIEGGEVSGTIDELIRHSVSKMSHTHFVSNDSAKRRLLQMGETEQSIFEIGSPDIDIMFSNQLPDLDYVKNYYNIPFKSYAIVMFHPVTTESDMMGQAAQNLIQVLKESGENYVLIYPNNDLGSNEIIRAFDPIVKNENFKIFPSLRFEYFLVLLKHSKGIIGNSSAGIREAPHYGIPTLNIGSRQNNRSENPDIIHCDYELNSIQEGLKKFDKTSHNIQPQHLFGNGKSDELFFKTLSDPTFWLTPRQKRFKDIS